MSSNTRFTIYTTQEEFDAVSTQNNSLYSSGSVLSILMDVNQYDAVIEESMTDQELERNGDVCVDVKCIKYSNTNHTEKTCIICTEDFKSDDLVSVLDCNHIFHNKCVVEWGHYNPCCPLCKNSINTL